MEAKEARKGLGNGPVTGLNEIEGVKGPSLPLVTRMNEKIRMRIRWDEGREKREESRSS